MSLRFRIKNPTVLAIRALKRELQTLRARINSARGGDLNKILHGLYVATDKLVKGLGKPTFDPIYLVKDTDPNPEDWNLNLQRLQSDLEAAFEEDQQVKQLQADALNASVLASKELQNRAALAQSYITDLRLLHGQLEQEVIIAGDDFANTDRIDFGFPLESPQAEVNVLQGIVTLKRTEALNVVSPNAKIEVAPIAPAEAASRAPTPLNDKRFYEGRFYASIGEARPEGGRWHLEERVKPGVVVPGSSTVFKIDVNENNVGDGSVFDQFPDLATEAAARPQGFPLNPDDIVVIDRGGTLDELTAFRKRMVDGNADTFWECEYVLHKPQLDDYVEQSRNTGDTTETNTNLPTITAEELRARAAQTDVDETDLEVEIVLNLERRESINFITLTPMNFHESAWLEVTDVSTARDGDDSFHVIEGFGDSLFDNVLTDEANEELTDGELKTTLAPNRYSYRGLGVYTFPPRDAQRIRIRLRQRTPVPSTYERMVVQLNRTLSATSTKFKGECFTGDQFVATPHGERMISRIQPGDQVYSWDVKKNRQVIEVVSKVLRHPPGHYCWIHFNLGRRIKTTAIHRFLTLRGWVRACDLVPDEDVVYHRHGHGWHFMKVRAVQLGAGLEPLYNLYTTGQHNFLVNGFVAHNFSHFRWLRTLWHKAFVDRAARASERMVIHNLPPGIHGAQIGSSQTVNLDAGQVGTPADLHRPGGV